MVAHIYSEQNAHRPARETFAHFVEVCGMLALNDRQKKREEVSIESALCKALGWYFPMMAKFRVASVEELVFRKFPYACPYCRQCPHDDGTCKTVRGTTRTVNHAAVRAVYEQNAKKRPVTLNEWQRMFQDIYPRNIEDRSGRSTVGLLEELGELAEAVRVFERYPKYFAGEAADVFSYLMGLANEYALRLERDTDKIFSWEDEFIQRYPGLCVQCGYAVCVCPLVPEATVGRMAKEIDLATLDPLFSHDSEEFSKSTAAAATSVLERLGGYAGLAQKFPFDRGEANQALVVFCLRAAEAVLAENPAVAERLRSAAMKIGMAATYAGSRKRPAEISDLINSVQTAMPEIGIDTVDGLIASADSKLSRQLGRILKPAAVLLVFANPRDTDPLRLQAEERVIREAIQLAKARDSFMLKTIAAATVDDLRRELLSQEYDIVHFSGHGEPGALLFETAEGSSLKSPLEAFASLFKSHPTVQCVVLNACSSLAQLVSIAPYTVGMEKSIEDRAAIEFARGFYDAVAAGKGYERAMEEGIVNVQLKDLQKNFPVKILSPKRAA
jgi:NTP pyrophosphatase (non-canonical NTP hydrolase)